MRGRNAFAVGVVGGLVMLGAAGSGVGGAPYAPPRTVDGQPDLQGVWDYRTVTPLERPVEQANKPLMTDQEIAQFERLQTAARNKDRRDGSPLTDVNREYNDFWWDYGTKVIGRQASLIVDPPNGRLPPLTAEGKRRAEARRALQAKIPDDGTGGRGFGSWLDRPFNERCLLWSVAGPPMMPGPYNNNVELFQAQDVVGIYNEMIHDHRMVPLDGREHLPQAVRQLMGDSRGHWEGDALIVETTNFTSRTAFRGTTQELRLIERFTRTAPDTLVYEYTVDDPAIFTKPWTARIPMTRNRQQVYEYACHEGNYALRYELESERLSERLAADTAKRGSH